MQYYGLSDIGKKRNENQDKIFVPEEDSNIKLFILADGMGGANAGGVASYAAVEFVKNYITDNFPKENIDREKIEDLIRIAMVKANNYVYSKSREKEEYAGMGTTLITVIVYKNKVYIGHIGDSRVYRIRKNIIRQLTKDHSYVQALLQSGSISKEEAKRHPQKNVLLKVLGCEMDVEPDIITKGFIKDDFILICTDGLTNMLESREIYDLVLENSAEVSTACNKLISESNSRGGFDNISVILIFK